MRVLIAAVLFLFAVAQSDAAVIVYGASGTPSTGYTTPEAACAAANVKRIEITSSYTLAAGLTCPADRTLSVKQGGLLVNNSGTPTTINGPFEAGPYQVFSGSGSVFVNRDTIPEWFGASASASASVNKAAIQAALTSSNKVIFGGGIYTVANDPESIFTISHNTEIEFINSSAIKVETTTTSHRVFSITNAVTRCLLKNVAVDFNYGSTTYSPQAIVIDGAQNIIIDNPLVYNSAVIRAWPNVGRGYGVYLLGNWWNVAINNPQIYDIMYAVITEPSSTGGNLKVHKGFVSNCSGDGVEINVPTGSASDILVDGVTFYRIGDGTTARGLGVASSGAAGPSVSNLKIVNSTFTECGYHGVHIEEGNRDVLIDDNYFYACGGLSGSAFGAAVYVAVTNVSRLSTNVVVSNNNIIGTADGKYGIYAGGSQSFAGLKLHNNYINGVAIGGTAGTGVFIGSVFSNATLTNNTVKNTNGVGVNYQAQSGSLEENTLYDDQASPTQTYGASLLSSATTNGVNIGANRMYGNINKGYYVGGAGYAQPLHVSSDIGGARTLSANAGYTPLTSFVNLGLSASGTIYIKYSRPSHHAAALYTFSWDGTTFTATLIRKTAEGSLTLTNAATDFAMSGTWLQSKVYWGGTAVSDINSEMFISGMILLK